MRVSSNKNPYIKFSVAAEVADAYEYDQTVPDTIEDIEDFDSGSKEKRAVRFELNIPLTDLEGLGWLGNCKFLHIPLGGSPKPPKPPTESESSEIKE